MLVLCRWPYFRFMLIISCSTCPGLWHSRLYFPVFPELWFCPCDGRVVASYCGLTHVKYLWVCLLTVVAWLGSVPHRHGTFPSGLHCSGRSWGAAAFLEEESHESEFWELVASPHFSSFSSFCWLLFLNLWRAEANLWESSGLTASVFTCWAISPALGSLLIEQPATEGSVSKNTQKKKANNCLSNLYLTLELIFGSIWCLGKALSPSSRQLHLNPFHRCLCICLYFRKLLQSRFPCEFVKDL